METSYGAADFKARCLKIIDAVAETGQEVQVTKRGKPMVRLIRESAKEAPPIWGLLAGTVHIKDDITRTGEQWDAENS